MKKVLLFILFILYSFLSVYGQDDSISLSDTLDRATYSVGGGAFVDARSQNTILIKGSIKDKTTNIPIEYANVALLRNDSSFLKGTVSDSIGYFAFDADSHQKHEDYILQIVHINYEKKNAKINSLDNSGLLIHLDPKSNSLSEVQVIGVQTKAKNKLNLEYKVTDKLREESLRTSQLLENIPTVFVDYNQNVYVKGSSKILILRNGIELPSNSLIDQIPPSTVQKVEITHTIPSKYANKNYSAIMNIITKRESNVSLLLDNNSSFDGKMYDAKVNLGVDTKKHSTYVFYKLYYRNFLEKHSIRNTQTSNPPDTTLFFRTKPRKESDNEFFYGYSFRPNEKITFGVDGYLSLYRENNHSVYDDAIRTKYANLRESFDTQNYKGYVNYQDSLNKFQGIFTHNHVKVNDDFVYFYNDEREESQQEKRRIYNVQLDYRRKIRDNISLAIGAEYSHIKNQELFYLINSYDNNYESFKGNNASGYVESSIELSEKWSLEAGFNLNNYKRTFGNDIKTEAFNFYPKLNVSYSINDLNNLRMGYSSYINNPTLWQMLSFTKEDAPGVFYKGNPYLKPEKHSTLQLEYSYSKGDFYYANSIYLKEARNKIQSKIYPESDYSLASYTNLHKRNDYGIDLTLSWRVTSWWSLNTYMDLMYRNIPDNDYYRANLFSYSGQLQSSWSLSPRISVMAQYMHNSKELVYNGYVKSFNSSLVVFSYRILDNLRLYFLAIEPFAKFESYSKLFNEKGFIERRSNIKVRTYLISFTYNVLRSKNQSKKRIYYNEEKKY